MKTVNLLLGSSERCVNNLVEAAVRDVCYPHAVVECSRVQHIDEFLRQGRGQWANLIFLAPDHLLPMGTRRGSRLEADEVANAIREIRARHSIPVFAVNVADENKTPLLEAGANNTFAFPLPLDALKAEVRRELNLSEAEPAEPAPNRPALASFLARGWQLLRQA